MARLQKKRKKKRELIGPDAPNMAHLGPSSLPNLSIACPFCDEDSRVSKVYGSYNNLLKDVDMDRVIITPQKIYYPRVCEMGHTFWTVECVPDRYDKMLEEIEEIKEFTRQEMAEYRDSLKEARIGYELTRHEKDRLKRAKEKAEREKQKEAERKEQKRLARIRRAEERERIRQAKLDGTYVPPEREDWPVITVRKKAGKSGYHEVKKRTEKQKEVWKKVISNNKERNAEAKRIKKRDEFLNTPGILSESYKEDMKELERIKKRDDFLNTPGILK